MRGRRAKEATQSLASRAGPPPCSPVRPEGAGRRRGTRAGWGAPGPPPALQSKSCTHSIWGQTRLCAPTPLPSARPARQSRPRALASPRARQRAVRRRRRRASLLPSFSSSSPRPHKRGLAPARRRWPASRRAQASPPRAARHRRSRRRSRSRGRPPRRRQRRTAATRTRARPPCPTSASLLLRPLRAKRPAQLPFPAPPAQSWQQLAVGGRRRPPGPARTPVGPPAQRARRHARAKA